MTPRLALNVFADQQLHRIKAVPLHPVSYQQPRPNGAQDPNEERPRGRVGRTITAVERRTQRLQQHFDWREKYWN